MAPVPEPNLSVEALPPFPCPPPDGAPPFPSRNTAFPGGTCSPFSEQGIGGLPLLSEVPAGAFPLLPGHEEAARSEGGAAGRFPAAEGSPPRIDPAEPALFPTDEGTQCLRYAEFAPGGSPADQGGSSAGGGEPASALSPDRRARRRRRAEALLLFLLCGLLLTVSWVQGQQEALSAKVIRLHVLAESDSEEHQSAKLRARDAVLSVLTPALSGAKDRQEAETVILSMTEELAEAASAAACCPVRVTLSEEVYPTRRYEHFSLPAGRYCSLRVTLGKGEGHNWWCVIYPALCTVTAEEHSTLAGNFNDEDWKLLTEESGGYALRFRLLDLWGRIANARARRSAEGEAEEEETFSPALASGTKIPAEDSRSAESSDSEPRENTRSSADGRPFLPPSDAVSDAGSPDSE